MDIQRSGSQASTKGPANYFAGTVRIDPLFQAHDPARWASALPSSPVPAQPGTSIPSGRPWW